MSRPSDQVRSLSRDRAEMAAMGSVAEAAKAAKAVAEAAATKSGVERAQLGMAALGETTVLVRVHSHQHHNPILSRCVAPVFTSEQPLLLLPSATVVVSCGAPAALGAFLQVASAHCGFLLGR